MKQPLLIITPGDPDGIGPEITWKALQSLSDPVLCVGARSPFDKMGAPVTELTEESLESVISHPSQRSNEPHLFLLPAPEKAPAGCLLPGFQAGWAIEKSVQLILQGKASGLVTGPIHKDRLQKGGYPYPGHTEFLARLCSDRSGVTPGVTLGVTPKVTMMLANEHLRVSLVTTHLGIHEVSASITRKKIRQVVIQTAEGLQKLWEIAKPRIAIAALNPHAGESGLFGREEIDVIEPEVHALQQEGFAIEGPFPADTLFAKHMAFPPQQRWDAVVCMYHDQGLIPVKLLDFQNTVNVTLGLPIIRTSVDHGVGFDIVGQGKADPSSLLAAIVLAKKMVQKRGAQ